ncbi:restriction endonuclease [Xanthomonas arboricola]|uniref:restriction endonuclease n=1 Tax=Xanthomonas arboricola TaxID=56448 RepID=UPI001E3BAE99|nr:restriction endonuclease [Xanthomonas arboricola]MCC8671700.1 restriction endonuclease [Xanthomonas arboricola]
MTKFKCASDITPEEYELQVKVWLESVGHELDSFSAAHREVLSSADGEYEIDVVVRFKALGGVQFKTLVECKKHKDPIKRELVQALHQKQQSLGANKAILFSTSAFQDGAVEFALVHGIALVRLVSGVAMYMQGSKGNDAPIPHIPTSVDPYAGLLYSPGDGFIPEGFNSHMNMALERYLHGPRS